MAARYSLSSKPKARTPTSVSASICRKYRRIRERPSPLNENVRRKLLIKATGSSCETPADPPVQPSQHQSAPSDPQVVSAGVELPTEDNMSFLDELRHTLLDKYKCLSAEEVRDGSYTWIIIYRPFTDPHAGLIQNPRLCVCFQSDKVQYSWQHYFTTYAEGVCDGISDITIYLDQLLPSSGYVVCPGIKEYPSEIRFKTKNLVEWGAPFNQKFSSTCSRWHIPNNSRQVVGSSGYNCCKQCKKLLHDIQQLVHRSEQTTEVQRIARTLPSSNYPLSKLSPASQKKRVTKVIEERKNLVQKLNKLQPFECSINDRQHNELLQVVSAIQNKGSAAVKQLICEGEAMLGADNNVLKDAWQQDVIERLDYERDQSQSVKGHRGNKWSQITIRMALAVYTRSPAAYEALRNFKLLQLPSVRSLKFYIDANLESAGDSIPRLKESRKQYLEMVEEKKNEVDASTERRVCLPIAQGVLIIDEVKVGAKLLWSSRSQKFIGHAMSQDELTSLYDVYSTLSPDYRKRQTTYILQTLWRDLTSDFDIIGPHFTNDATFPHHFLCSILMESIHQFHICGFEVVAVVCDGASSNMTMIKEMSGAERKAYSPDPDTPIFPCFKSPYTDRLVYFVICPSHQLKNMVAALFQSRPSDRGGTRCFSCKGCEFGWAVIESMYQREMSRIREGKCSRVPKLKESHILRDSWTRLNVLPSKIMQQDEVLSELKEYARSDPKPDDAASVEMVISYLEALNGLFEKSILGQRVRVFNSSGSTIQRMEISFNFFAEWAKEKPLDEVDSKQFLSWQTWDLLRIMWFGFRGVVEDFLAANPGYHINPRRLNGSAVETLFSQLKHTTGGHLMSVNYETAKATMLTKAQAKGKDSYRSSSLYLRKTELVRKPKST